MKQLLIIFLIVIGLTGCATKPKAPPAPQSVAVGVAQSKTSSATVSTQKTKTNVDSARADLSNIESKTLKAIEIAKQIELLAQ